MPKKPSRAQERQRLLDAAAQVQVPDDCDVIVVGGGAAGLVAAITAAEQGAQVLVLERDLACGNKILVTGNGRCNFANSDLDPTRYNNPAFVEAVCGTAWLDDILQFFEASGLLWCQEGGRLYPASRVAASVRNVLLRRAARAGVILAPAHEVIDIERIDTLHPLNPLRHGPERAKDPAFGMSCEVACVQAWREERLAILPNAQAVVLATGGGAHPHLIDLGLATSISTPTLCPLACEDSPLMRLDGRRAQVRATLTRQGEDAPCWSEAGEVLFRSYGISGIVTFDLSRRAQKGDLVELDLAPEVSAHALRTLIDPADAGTPAPAALDGVVDPQIAASLERLAAERWDVAFAGRAAPADDTDALVRLTKALPLRVTGPTEINHAQVMRGGLLNEQFDPATLACRSHDWLFACGEALDVDGDCGGFNLAWAWKSGMVAGSSAAKLALARRGYA